mmetsp:Transcript_25086/g.47144  ORF Transcript_25086/g.47144 Transcript_25086/m.47144 type:complete len:579 (-) Transcript_25086:73-1809(-)
MQRLGPGLVRLRRPLAAPPLRALGSSIEKKPRLSNVKISDVLQRKHTERWVDSTICYSTTVGEATQIVIERGLSGLMVVDKSTNINSETHQKGKVLGMMTSRDLLRRFSKGRLEGRSFDEVGGERVEDFMTPLNKVVYGRPEETVGQARDVMAKVGIKCLPIMSKEGRVEGILTARDMTDYGLDAKDKGGKEAFLNSISGRVGMSEHASMADPPSFMAYELNAMNKPLYVNVGTDAMPHPFKTESGVAGNKRLHGPGDYATDCDLSEDAMFTFRPENTTSNKELTYAGVGDGVGSWREYGVDPRLFSRALMGACEDYLKEMDEASKFDDVVIPVKPNEILAQAHQRVKDMDVIGSSTACVMLFDNEAHQIHFSNLGDSGIIVLRHIDSDVAGVLKRDRVTKREERKSDLRVNFVSQQQLKSFNHPYQFGWTGKENEGDKSSSFKDASDLCTSSIHIRRGDIVIMATDGLFDNVDVDDICSIVLQWEIANGFIDDSGDIALREKRWGKGEGKGYKEGYTVEDLAEELTSVARDRSLRDDIDSPFAILAKENDIMWSGGMPDDCSIVVLHVVGEGSQLAL